MFFIVIRGVAIKQKSTVLGLDGAFAFLTRNREKTIRNNLWKKPAPSLLEGTTTSHIEFLCHEVCSILCKEKESERKFQRVEIVLGDFR